jgi:aspartate/methionine/tyrosine aminotransferase
MHAPLTAARLEAIPFAGIRRVFEKAGRIEAAGAKVIHFEIGRPDFDTPDHIKRAAVHALDRGFVHYTPNAGIPELRRALAAAIAAEKGAAFDPEREIMVTAGGQHAMALSLLAMLDPGDEVLVPDPGYSQFASCVRLCGGEPVPLPLLPEENYFPDLDWARRRIGPRTRAVILNSPHNPTGAVLEPAQVEAVCRFADDHGLVLFSDEAYDRILYPESAFCSPARFSALRRRTVLWGSLSKTYAMTGWRIGYLAAPPEVIAAAVKVQQNTMLSVCSFAQAGAVAALTGPQECVAAMVAEFDRRRRAVLAAAAAIPGLECPGRPAGAFYVFLRHRGFGRDSAALADRLLEEAHTAVVPGSSFGARGEGFIRISYAVSLEDCLEGMRRIAAALAQRPPEGARG